MKVAMVLDRIIIGGAENVCLDLLKRFSLVFDYDLVTITHDSNKIDNIPESLKVRIKHLNRKSRLNIFDAFRLNEILCAYDIIHVHLRHTYRYVAWVRLIFRGKYKLILHDHHGKIYIDDSRPFFEYKLLKPDYFIGVCEKLTLWSMGLWKLNEEKASTLINLPSVSTRKEIDSVQLVQKAYFVNVGNIKNSKNQAFSARIAEIMSKSILFIGNNQEDDYFKKLSTYKNVEMLENFRVSLYELKEFRFGLYTSITESGPLVVLEYLMAGIPFLAYKVGGMSDAIETYFPEYFMDNFQIEDWVQRINDIEKSPISPEVYELRLSQLMNESFNPATYKNMLNQIYQSLI